MDFLTLLNGSCEQVETAVARLVQDDSPEAAALLLRRLAGPLSGEADFEEFSERFQVKSRIRLGLMSMSDLDCQTSLLLNELPFLYDSESASLRGLAYKSEPVAIPFETNPWGITPEATFEEALFQVWGKAALEAVYQQLSARLVGICLIETSDGPLLGYIDIRERERYEIDEALFRQPAPPRERREAWRWFGRADVSMFTGEAPLQEEPELPIPSTFQSLLQVHRRLSDGMWQLYEPGREERVDRFFDGDASTLETFTELMERPTTEFAFFFSYGDDRSNLLDLANGRVHWLANPWEKFGEGEVFDTWLANIVHEQWLYLDDDL